MRLPLLAIVTTIGLATPLTGIAQSYLTPEQVLQQNNGAFLVPSHQRGAQWTADLNAQQNADRHPVVSHDPWDPVQDDGIPPPPAAMLEEVQPALPPPAAINPYQGMDPITARLLARLEQQNSILQSSLLSTAAQNDAPLAQTGPAAILSVIAMAGATVWTLRRARGMERFVRGL